MMLNAWAQRNEKSRADAAIWLGNSDDVIALHGPDGRFKRASQSASAVFGLSQDELIDLRLMDVVAPADQPRLLAALASVSGEGKEGRARFDCQLRRGAILGAHVEIALSRLPDGGLRSVTRPIEHRLSREFELLEEKKRALEAASRKADHLANVSHEIRTPLNAVIGFADALYSEQFGPIENEKYRDYARVIHESGAHLQTLITDLLDLSKAEANEMPLTLEPCDPGEIVIFCADMMRLQAGQAGLYIRTNIEPGLGQVMLDVKVTRQIILNAVSNALKFTKEGGIIIGVHKNDDELVFDISDTGIGMSPDDLSKIGKRFRQAHKEGVRGAKGTGIGLALSKALARAHGGELNLISEVGQGTTAILSLPYTPVETEDKPGHDAGANVMPFRETKKRA